MENTKICTKCGRELPLECFNKDKSKKDGLQCRCKQCIAKHYQDNRKNILEKMAKHYQDNRGKKLEYQKQYTTRHKEEISKRNAQYYQDNREKRLEKQKNYYIANKEKILIQQKQYYTENADLIKEWHKQYYQTLKGTAYKRRFGNLYEDRKYGRCGKDEDILPSLEYYMWGLQQPDFYDGKYYPIEEMGFDRIYNDKPHSIANVVPCSTANNRRRGTKSFEEFLAECKQQNVVI